MKKNIFSIAGASLAATAGLLCLGATTPASAQFYVSGSQLKDANGVNFIPRGVNNPHIWFDSQSYNLLPNLANRKTNCVRIVWQMWGSAARLDQIIQRCRELRMVPMVELHDFTGSNNNNDLIAATNYYTRSDVLAVLKKHQRYLLLNIANEWGDSYKSEWDWKEAYKQPITRLRNAGITTTIVLDMPGWGQNGNAGLWYGQELLNHDPRRNLLFSIHMYGSWNNSNDIWGVTWSYKNKNLPLIIGEFGYNYNNGYNNLNCKVDHRVVMQASTYFGFGYLAWSTQGNDSSNAWLDLMTNWTTTNWWGNEVFYNTSWSISNSAVSATAW
jgi:mannan endo-1,4-beta-mannosidase